MVRRRRAATALLVALIPCALFAATQTYEYDTLGRLKRVTDSGGQQITYTLDPAGNRTQVATAANAAGTLSFAPATYAVTEGTASITITVTRTGGSAGAVSVGYSTSNGTAIAGSDFTATGGTLNWASGDAASKSFAVPILNDSTAESPETFSVGLANVTGGAALGTVAATVTITDDDPSLPSVPANLRTVPADFSSTGNFTVLWDASSGPLNHYTLNEVISTGGTNNYTVVPPSTSKAFSKGTLLPRTFTYTVRACASADESLCSAWSPPVSIDVESGN